MGSFVVAKELWLMWTKKKDNQRESPIWYRQSERRIVEWRGDLPRVGELSKGRLSGSKIMARLNRQCDVLINKKVAGDILLVRKIQTRRTKMIK